MFCECMVGRIVLILIFILVFFNYARFDFKLFLKTDLQVSLPRIFRLMITNICIETIFGLNMSFVRVLAILGIGEARN